MLTTQKSQELDWRIIEMALNSGASLACVAHEVANLYLLLASDEARYISGEVIRIDGGMVIGR
jgi:NAD(P)-dependent dehydrogenase (short-subunit alcohol dehydrogenase family)